MISLLRTSQYEPVKEREHPLFQIDWLGDFEIEDTVAAASHRPTPKTERRSKGASSPICDTLKDNETRHGSPRSRSRRIGTLKLPSPSTNPATQLPRSRGIRSSQLEELGLSC